MADKKWTESVKNDGKIDFSSFTNGIEDMLNQELSRYKPETGPMKADRRLIDSALMLADVVIVHDSGIFYNREHSLHITSAREQFRRDFGDFVCNGLSAWTFKTAHRHAESIADKISDYTSTTLQEHQKQAVATAVT